MRYTLSLLTYLLLLSLWGHPCEAQQAVLGTVSSIDAAQSRLHIKTRSTLFGGGGEEFMLDISGLEEESWNKLSPGDSIRVWVEGSTTDPSATPVARSMHSWSKNLSGTTDPTGVRRRLSRDSFSRSSYSGGNPRGMGGSRSRGGGMSGGGRR